MRKHLLIFIVIFVLSILAVELFLSIVPPFNRLVTFYDAKNKDWSPNSEFIYKGGHVGTLSTFTVKVRTNSLGFHDVDHSFEKKDGVYRILVLGDSQVEAIQVQLDRTFHRLLEKKLQEAGYKVEVIALGRSGIGPGEALKLYESLGKRFDPDTVIWSFTDINDVSDSSPAFRKIVKMRQREAWMPLSKGIAPEKIPKILRQSLRRSKLLSLLLTRRFRFFEKKDITLKSNNKIIAKNDDSRYEAITNWEYLVCLKNWPSFYFDVWETFRSELVRLIQDVKGAGSKMIIVSSSGTYPEYLKTQYGGFEWDLDKPDRLTREIADLYEVDFINMKDVYRKHETSTKKTVTYMLDGHLNEDGHRLVAEVLADRMAGYFNSADSKE